MPFFSVIIPVYNVAPYLRACLDSLERSMARVEDSIGIELICIDDGSTDESGDILDRFVQRIDTGAEDAKGGRLVCRVVHQANRGLGAARNFGLDLAQGEWILFVDSDDAVETDYFAEVLRMAREYAPDAILFSHRTVASLEVCDTGSPTAATSEVITSDAAIFERLNSRFAWNVAYRRESVGNLRFANITPGEDVLFSCGMIPRVKCIAQTKAVLYRYLQRSGSLMHKFESRLSQIESCGVSMLGRIDCVCRWKGFASVRRSMYSMVRTTYVGQCYMLTSRISRTDKEAGWNTYCDYGSRICTVGCGFIPPIVCFIWQRIFSSRFRIGFYVLMYLPWRIRVCLLRVPGVNALKRLIRG